MAYFAAVFSLTFLLSLGTIQGECITNYNSSENYFPFGYSSSGPFSLPVEAVVNEAQKFSVQYNNAYKLVHNTFSNTTYFLYQCGAPVTSDYNASISPVKIPASALAIDSTIPIAFLELLGLLPTVKGVSLQYTSPYVNSPCVQKLLEDGTIKQLDSSSSDFEDFSGLTLTALQGQPKYNSSFVYFDASQDPGPLKRAEWIKYLAVFFNLELNATQTFSQIEANYQCLNGSSSLAQKPTVVWLSEYPEGVILIDKAAYKTQLTLDAGGSTLDDSMYRTYNLSLKSDLAAFKSTLEKVDVIIDEIFTASPDNYTIDTFKTKLKIAAAENFTFLSQKRVWREDRRVQSGSFGLDWYEGALAQPQVILQELLGIFDTSRSHEHVYFRNLAEAESIVKLSSNDCTATDPTAALLPTIFECPVKTSLSPTASPPPVNGGSALRVFGMETMALYLAIFAVALLFA